jgi:hypothetical protein
MIESLDYPPVQPIKLRCEALFRTLSPIVLGTLVYFSMSTVSDGVEPEAGAWISTEVSPF